MNNTQNTTIVLLMITAGILVAMLISAGNDSAAYGDSAVRQGKYVMVTGGYDKNTDLLYVVNIETQKLAVYAPNEHKRTIDRMGTALSLKPAATPRR
ncbi:MAG: hypothetical protein GY794_11925 [bacterium]|nr:hypothetical protein [bacterium]